MTPHKLAQFKKRHGLTNVQLAEILHLKVHETRKDHSTVQAMLKGTWNGNWKTVGFYIRDWEENNCV